MSPSRVPVATSKVMPGPFWLAFPSETRQTYLQPYRMLLHVRRRNRSIYRFDDSHGHCRHRHFPGHTTYGNSATLCFGTNDGHPTSEIVSDTCSKPPRGVFSVSHSDSEAASMAEHFGLLASARLTPRFGWISTYFAGTASLQRLVLLQYQSKRTHLSKTLLVGRAR